MQSNLGKTMNEEIGPEIVCCQRFSNRCTTFGFKGGRQERLMAIQAGISKGLNQWKVGKVTPVLVEGESSETELLLAGRTPTTAPDVDGRVLINEGEGIVGDIMPVLITEAYEYDLVGRILTE
jgi:ribosomal protein S12 methylthiotransferase